MPAQKARGSLYGSFYTEGAEGVGLITCFPDRSHVALEAYPAVSSPLRRKGHQGRFIGQVQEVCCKGQDRFYSWFSLCGGERKGRGKHLPF